MKHILQLYRQPYDPNRPMVCFDEKSLQLLKDSREPMAMRPAHSRRQDYEYKRNGMRHLFMFVEPKGHHVLVTRRRTTHDFAYAMRDLVETPYPDAEGIDVVPDNLNIHTRSTDIVSAPGR
jgi:hypothetical protein